MELFETFKIFHIVIQKCSYVLFRDKEMKDNQKKHINT